MNSQIQALVISSGIYDCITDPYDKHNTGDPNGSVMDDLEKFAQLIVRECYEHCKGQILDKEVADTNELTYNDAVGDCANGLLQHFGVEE
jgi:hypothetical protein